MSNGVRMRKGLTGEQLRALSHPLRLRMLEVLREGPATASALGRRLGESSGATSYHLRALAKAGVVEEDERGSKRERWWRRVDSFTLISRAMPTELDAAEAAALEAALARIDAFFLDRDDARCAAGRISATRSARSGRTPRCSATGRCSPRRRR